MPSDGECSVSQQCWGMSISGDKAKQAMNSVACLLSVNAVCSQQSEPGCGMCSSNKYTCMQDYQAADWAAGQRYWAVHSSLDGKAAHSSFSQAPPHPCHTSPHLQGGASSFSLSMHGQRSSAECPPDWVSLQLGHGLVSFLSASIHVGGEVAGVLTLAHTHPQGFSAQE